MITREQLDWSRCPYPPFEHQVEGVLALLNNPNFALLDEMGIGKSYQIVTAACFAFELGLIDTVIVASPAAVKPVWFGSFESKGEIAEHSFMPFSVWEYHGDVLSVKRTSFDAAHMPERYLRWVITNFEFIRQRGRAEQLLAMLDDKNAWLVVDESSRISSPSALQTKAVWKLAGRETRKFNKGGIVRKPIDEAGHPIKRRTILNGTPIGNSPLDLYAQFRVLDPRIIGVENMTHMRNKYAVVMTKRNNVTNQNYPSIVGYQNLDDLKTRLAPHALRRLKKDCLDLPEKLYTTREVAMSAAAWSIYKQMRDDAAATLSDGREVVTYQQGVKFLRLAQLTAGFVGDVDEHQNVITHRIGTEKLEGTLDVVEDILRDDPKASTLIWCRFLPELHALADALKKYGAVYTIHGGQKEKERRAAVDALRPGQNLPIPQFVVGITQAGGLGLNLTAAHYTIYSTNDFSLINRLQSEDRVHRPGQKFPCTYIDMVLTGPRGERTIDHIARDALRNKQDLASWTSEVWKRELLRER